MSSAYYQCQTCGFGTMFLDELKNHLCSTSSKIYICNKCGKKMFGHDNLLKHVCEVKK